MQYRVVSFPVWTSVISRRLLREDRIVLLDHCEETRFSLCLCATQHAAALFVLCGATSFVAAGSFEFESWATEFRLSAEFDLLAWFSYAGIACTLANLRCLPATRNV